MAEGFSIPPLPHTFSVSTTTSPAPTMSFPGGPGPAQTPSNQPGGPVSLTTGPVSPGSDSSTFPTPSDTPTDSLTTSPLTSLTPTPTPTPTPSTTPPISSPTAIGAVSTHHSHAGAIAGAVIGVLAALALLATLGFCVRRRRYRAGAAPLASPPLESGLYTEPKPRSRPASRVAAPVHTAHSASVGTVESFGAARTHESHDSFGAARTYESQGTLADVRDDEDAYLEKLEAAEGPIVGSLPTLPDAPILARPPAASPYVGVRNRRSVGEAIAATEHAHKRTRTRSQDLSARVPVPGPGSPTYPPTSSTELTSPKAGGARKMPRKKPVPRYSADGVPQAEGASPPAAASPFADAGQPFHDGRPVHYLIPDMPPPQR